MAAATTIELDRRVGFLMCVGGLVDELGALEGELLWNDGGSGIIDVVAAHDPKLADLLLDLAEANARVLDHVQAASEPHELEPSRDPASVLAIIAAKRGA